VKRALSPKQPKPAYHCLVQAISYLIRDEGLSIAQARIEMKRALQQVIREHCVFKPRPTGKPKTEWRE